MHRPLMLLTLAASLSFALAGCGPSLGSVEGTVTLDGKPIKGVEVTFQPVGEEGGTAIGYTDAQGHYTLHYPGHEEGAPPGEYDVRLAGGEGGAVDGAPRVHIPAKYNSESDLKRTVEPGANTFDFPLESK